MAADKKTASVETVRPDGEGDTKRGRSTIEFPYLDLDDSIEIATNVHAIGGSGCQWDQLAAQLKQAANGGGFRLRLITAKVYGLLTYDRGQITLTSLGQRINDPQQQKQARAESFLNVPLYKAIYERFKGVSLPPTAGLQREIEQLGVAPKQKDKARQVFLRSAKSAGFFEFGADRLVFPSGVKGQPEANQKQEPPSGLRKSIGGGSGDGSLPPFIQVLLDALPEPGTEWPTSERKKWLQTAEHLFGLFYKGDGKSMDGE